uniref:Cytochrome b6-f complex subunit 6 n=1 Tax=Apophlaea sinclairii TaxID=212746 RepID=A0A1C9CBM0_9FLOR|nr:cytochrome b6-f complex subunit VI [Apophlaea sinclairii]AOM65744.1 cytochrome b6-f complex subunit VI [Apophlaea sinclairii]
MSVLISYSLFLVIFLSLAIILFWGLQKIKLL